MLGVGGIVLFSTLTIPSKERILLGAIMLISLPIMIACELLVFYRHLRPIQAIFKNGQPTSEQLKTAYLQTHQFPTLSVRRTFGPHFLGLLVPAVIMAFVFIKSGYLKLPYSYIGIASAVAFMIASMHAMIEFFLTSKAIRPVVAYIRDKHKQLYKQDITLGGRVLVSIRTKFRLSAFLIGTLPLLLFGLASQIRLDRIQGEGSSAYWQWAGIILIIGVLYSLLGASLLSRNIEDPIHTIQEGMSSVQAGNFDSSAADIYSDEFSKLVAGFNHMVNGLKERDILKQIEPADAMADLLPGVRSHHERYDGKGYPDGLAGTDIPLFGRAIAIADAFDAMTSDRPYRRGMTYERAISIIEEGKGTQWDPKLAQLFIESLRGKERTDEEAS
ncbi:HD domain-containing phosphohydrolase [Paenibacillus sp. PL91]|uniref:HD domain-containing phosphohydrolase n=1 Tax=Paenibacillus sp. PL91 TaxID=2729538 RepID=UPI00295007B0|nr:HD domain-containing phosphohydrolase [Paenibacillus sp. PL91]